MTNAFDQALQKATGGYPVDTLIVTKNEDGEPEVSMFVLDADNQLLHVSYDPEGGIIFKTAQQDELLFSRQLLETIAKMQVSADRRWKELQRHWVDDKATWEGFEHLLDTPDIQ
ncbi:hypothetical protein SAMN05880590_1151 [Rhizobium sp. RU35A]|uniref:hypothetical protein n=1 Tax=Rhizobium/Agrobacterium group TaxID=227290 RepID=UPI000953D6AE|nr:MULTISPECIES: hypothetical protein [Rhizobium/Agrobacterium group]MCW0983757.1 hypothetical protein [Agrobacterium sp. BT-220-3]QCM13682.1 hypothetical protein CFBP6625_24975 [Agrobacterium tumefaciens]SIR24233.1 hypothetical protein SAMN05880590_1151 [Rhizobium sp. RU35A]